MTRNDFIEDITSWYELIDFCNDEGCEDYVEDVYSEDSYDDYINEEVRDRVRQDGWQDILSWLQNLPDGYDYYIRDDYGEWRGADDDDFESIKRDVIDYMDDGEYWDDDEEEEPVSNETYADPEDAIPVEDEGVSFAELFTACNSKVQKLKSKAIADAAAEERAEETAFDELCVSVGISVTVGGSK